MKYVVTLLIVLMASTANAFEFEKRFAAYEKQQGPGLAVLVVKDGKTIFSRGYGWAKLGKGKQKIYPSTNFNLASNSKQFTAFALLSLEQKGLISLDDKVSKFIPELPSYLGGIRVKHLVFHTSGAPDYMEVCDTKKKVVNADVIAYLGTKSKLDFETGTKHEYSNTGYVLLSEVLSRAAKKPFPEILKSEIFDKLGMKDTTVFSVENETKIANRSYGIGEWPFFEPKDDHPCNYVFGDGGVYTSLNDYTKWALALESAKVLSPEFHARIFEPGKLDSGEPIKYAYGWMKDEHNGHVMLAHSGGWVGFRSFVANVPDQKLWVAVFSNYRGVSIWDSTKAVLDEFVEKK